MADQKVALVTGAGSGIGLATAKKYLEEGYQVALVDLNKDAVEKAVKDFDPKYQDQVLVVACDISKSKEVDEAVKEAVDHFGRLDAAVNCAGIPGAFKKLGKLSDDDFQKVLQIDLAGTFYCVRAELNYFDTVKHGAIVNVSAEAGIMASPTMSDYATVKAGINGLTRAAAIDYVRDGIRVNAIAPGGTYTNMTADTIDNTDFGEYIKRVVPMGRIAKPEEIANTIYYLGSDESSFTTGQVVAADGGQSIGLM